MPASVAAQPVWAVVISAAGGSRRMGGVKKEYLPLEDGRTVLGTAAAAFAACPRVGPIVIAVPPGAEGGAAAARECLPGEVVSREALPGKGLFFVPGGETRQASVYNALAFLADRAAPDYVLVHDGARPWVPAELILRVMDAAERRGAAIPVLPVVETPKELEPGGGLVKRHLRRERVGLAQTPQGFAFPGLLAAHERARSPAGALPGGYTDDAEVWGAWGGAVAAVPGAAENRKITFPGDLEPARRL